MPRLRLSRAIPLLPRLLSWLLRIELRNMKLFYYAVRTGAVQRDNLGRILAHRTVRVITTRSYGEYGLHSIMQLASVNFKRNASFCQDADELSGSLHMTDGWWQTEQMSAFQEALCYLGFLLKTAMSCGVTPCSQVDEHQRFTRVHCFCLQGWRYVAVRISDLRTVGLFFS